MNIKFNQRFYQFVVVIWLTLSVASVYLAILNWYRLSQQLKQGREAFEVQESANTILRLLVDCETSQRGFCLTGMREFLEPMTNSRIALAQEFDLVLAKVKNDPAALQETVNLRASTEVVLARIDDAVRNYEKNGYKASRDTSGNLEIKSVMDKVREQVAAIQALRVNLVTDGGEASRQQLTRATITSLVAGVIGVAAGVFAFWLARILSEHQRREKELMADKLKAENSSAEKTVFLANMSHEIRTPMNAIMGFSELLAAELATPRQRHYLDIIRKSAAALLQLINDILDMAKIEAGVLVSHQEPTDVRDICGFVLAMFTEMAANKNLKLECLVAEDLPNALLLDRIRFRQILVNLVGNAIKYTNQGKVSLGVSWEKPESTASQINLLIEVQDTGVGIPEDKLEVIFKPFIQSGAHRDLEKSGTGLGLAIVRRLTEAMGGTIKATSVLGRGSVFHLRLPRVHVSVRLPVGDAETADIRVDFSTLRPSRILVADDNENNCELLAAMFGGSPHQLTFAHNGHEAVGKAQIVLPDLILLDIRMPGLDGPQALAEIRKIPGLELTPAIAVTAARSSLTPGEKDLKEIFSGYLRKPFTTAELFRELAHFIPAQTPAAAVEPRLQPPLPATPELLQELERIKVAEWHQALAGGAINDAKILAARLARLAEQHHCDPLQQYAVTLAGFAAGYQVVPLENQLQAFPALLARLKTHGGTA